MSWNSWLDEIVEWDQSEYIKRRLAIHKLCKYGLIPFLESHGYSVAVDHKELGSRIATGLYINQGKSFMESNWRFGPVENKCMSEEYELYFNHHIDTDEWEKFWQIWGLWSDVDPASTYGAFRQEDIRYYMWSQVCSDQSKQIQKLREDEDEYAPEHEGGDAYLKDARESGEWGGIRK